MVKEFDLNIQKILENWEVYHAVREIIANALDEQKLTGTKDISIRKENGIWHITDYGRGLNYHHLTQNENDEKLSAEGLIGKFGVGLKDSLAVFYRNGIHVTIRSCYGVITLKQMKKAGFDDVMTLHAEIADPDDPNMVGTDVSLDGCTNKDIERAKNLFLCFSHETILEDTGFGAVLEKPIHANAGIYIHGVKVAEESNFLFSYNITNLPNKLRKALNRERDNVGRAAYTDSIKNIVKSVEDEAVLRAYMHDLEQVTKGGGHDEMNWIDVQLYVLEQLSRKNDKLLFITGDEAVKRRAEVSDAQDEGYQIFIIPDKLKEKAKSIRTVMTLEKYNQSKNNAFSGDALNISDLTPAEQEVYNMMPEILAFMNGLPGVIASVKISEELYTDEKKTITLGLWDAKTRTIWIRRSQLSSIENFAGTLILECTHAASRCGDVSRAFDFVLSPNTVKNVFVDFLEDNRKNLRFKTPAFIGIDEIKVKKLGELTVITDIEHRTLYDILQGRNQKTLTEYFMSLRDREKVQWVCSDMYRPFEKSISDAMPNARWAIDHFHVVMKANEAVDAVRREIQKGMARVDRIKTKKGLAYTLKTRLKDLDPEDKAKIKAARSNPELAPLATAFDLKDDFFNIYDENPSSKDNAEKAFKQWEQSIPKGAIYDKFRELAATVHRFEDQIFAYWDCPIAISNGYTECTNRLIRENNLRGRGYSFEVLRARTLYRKANLRAMLENGLIDVGPVIPEDQPVFHFESAKEDEDEDLEDDYEPFPNPEEE